MSVLAITMIMMMMMIFMMMMATMMRTMAKIVMIAKLDTVRRFKVVQCPLQPDKDSKLRSNKDDCDDDDDDDGGGHVDEGGDNVGGDVDDDHRKCIQCCPSNLFQKFKSVSSDASPSHNQFTSL